MKQTYRILPIYTSDVSGVCSALYELGGLTVMHDPSGCNSTYNTHDEIRWYEKDSLIFISGLSERDAIMGNDEKFIRDVLDAANEFRPRFIAITNSPIPYLMSTDFPAITRRLERETGIPAFYVPANGMYDYVCGASKAFERVALRLVDEKYDRKSETNSMKSVNVLGLTPLDHAAAGSVSSIKNFLTDAGWQVNSLWAMDGTPDDITRAGEADVNLVVSSTGLAAAKVLQERFGSPYVVGLPVGGFKEILVRDMEQAARSDENIVSYIGAECAYANSGAFSFNSGATHTSPFLPAGSQEADAGSSGYADDFSRRSVYAADTGSTGEHRPILPGEGFMPTTVGSLILIGEPVTMGSLAAAIRQEQGRNTKVICPTEIHEGLLRASDRAVHGEEETETALMKEALAKGSSSGGSPIEVVGDPLYKLICPKDTIFQPLPHLALSGRIYLKDMVDLAGLEKITI